MVNSSKIGIKLLLSSYTVKKSLAIFPSPAGISPTKLTLASINLIIPHLFVVIMVSDIPAGEGKIANLFFYSVVQFISQ